MLNAAVTIKGQVTIPRSIRRRLGVDHGGRVKFFVRPDGAVVILPVVPATALRGLFELRRDAVTVEAMDEAIAGGVAERFRAAGDNR